MLARNVQREIERDLNLQSKAAMANSDAGTSSGSAGGGKYQVFLSFCGRDTRDGFTSFLYEGLRKNGIHAFMDDEEIRDGKKIADEILQAIDGSQIYVPIFSENYTRRKWCLLELIRMVDNISKSNEKQIRPIFFYVEPNHLDSCKNFIGQLKKEHEKKQREKKQQETFPYELESWKLESWEEAPTKVVESKGSKLQKGVSQAKFVDKIVEELLQELKIKYKSVTKDLVGLDHRVAKVLKLLDVDGRNQVRFLGIYGMGGIGKTTLAKVVYDELYSRFGNWCAFLDDIQETSKKSLVSLQKKLLTAIGRSSAAGSIHHVDNGRKKIGEIIGGEEVLLVLDDVGEEEQIKNLIGCRLHDGTIVIITTRNIKVLEFVDREMKEINSDRALQILTYEMEGMEFSNAIELFKRHAFRGGSLGGSLAKDFDNLSVDIVNTTGGLPLALEVIGSLLHGKPKAKWESTLKQLRKVPHKDVQKTLMISYKDLNYRQREIFLDITCFFINEDKTNANYMWEACGFYPNVEIDILVEMSLIDIKDNKFWMHDQLRDLGQEIVCQESPTILGRRSRLWTNEEVLDLVRTKLRKKKVEAIDLRGSSHISIENEEIERFESLRFLRLSNGTLHGDFTDCLPMLKWISWSSPQPNCSVVNMHLKNLVVLEFFDNHFIDESKVWDSLKMATKLKSLALVKCHRITITPDLSKCLALERLTFHDCRRLRVINSLLDLDITHCGLVERVPELINRHSRLSILNLRRCHEIKELPKLPTSLVSLHVESHSLEVVPNLSELTNLIELFLSNGSGLSFDSRSSKLHMWDLRWIEGLTKLEKLYLNLVNVAELPTKSGSHRPKDHSLPSSELNDFRLTGSLLSNLENLSKLTLHFSRVQEMQLALDGLLQLQYLMLGYCDLQSLSLPSSVRTLTVYECPNMTEIQFLGTSASLEKLTIQDCKSIGKIVLRGEVGSSEVLNQSESSLRESACCSSEVLPNALKKLKKLVLIDCKNVPEIQVIGRLSSLQDIDIVGCDAMVKLSGVSNLNNLKSLCIGNCPKLQSVEGLDELESLIALRVVYCPSLETLLDGSNSKILGRCRIDVRWCKKLLNNPLYSFNLEGYKRRAQQGTPQPETNKERAKMEGDAEEPNTEPQLRFHPSASSQDQDINEEPPIDDVRERTPPGNQNQSREQDSNPQSNSLLASTELQLQFHPSGSRDHEINEEPPIDDVREGTPPGNQNQTREQDSNPQSLDELAQPITFSDRFMTCLVGIWECVCNCDLALKQKFFEVRNRGSL